MTIVNFVFQYLHSTDTLSNFYIKVLFNNLNKYIIRYILLLFNPITNLHQNLNPHLDMDLNDYVLILNPDPNLHFLILNKNLNLNKNINLNVYVLVLNSN